MTMQITKPNNETSLRLQRTYDAPAEDVFDAWTNPEVLRRWWAVNAAGITPIAEVDLRVGGRYRISMEDPESGKKYTAGGEYREVSRPNRLVYSWQWEQEDGELGHLSTVAVDFRAEGEQTTSCSNTPASSPGIARLARARLGRRTGGIPNASARARRTDVLTDARTAIRSPPGHSRRGSENKPHTTNNKGARKWRTICWHTPAVAWQQQRPSANRRWRPGGNGLASSAQRSLRPATRSAHPRP